MPTWPSARRSGRSCWCPCKRGTVHERQLGFPPTITTRVQGAAEAFQSSLGGMGLLPLVAVLVVYIVLGILYESLVHPVTILSGLPSAAVGGLLTLLLFGREPDFDGLIGLILLLGIVKESAIMQSGFALEARRAGRSPDDAISRAPWSASAPS